MRVHNKNFLILSTLEAELSGNYLDKKAQH